VAASPSAIAASVGLVSASSHGNCSSLVRSFDGTAANAYGAGAKAHYTTLP
jgi:hypothetical protein